MNKDRRRNGKSTCWAFHGLASAIAKGLPFLGSNRAPEVADETESVSFNGQCPQASLSKEGCGGWALLTSSVLKSHPGSAVCTLHPSIGDVGL